MLDVSVLFPCSLAFTINLSARGDGDAEKKRLKEKTRAGKRQKAVSQKYSAPCGKTCFVIDLFLCH